jgi:hypothetical protein
LTVAAQIVTVESRHQTLIRTLSKAAGVPSPFDTPLGVRPIFTLAAGFISSCPAGSNLDIVAFPAATLATTGTIAINQNISVSTTATGATFCAFTNGGIPGGTAFSPMTNGNCQVPQIVAGDTYLFLSSAAPSTGILTDDITVAGPIVLSIS